MVIHIRTLPHFVKTIMSRKEDTGELPIFGGFGVWEGISSLLFVSVTKTRVLRTRVDLCYCCGPFRACVGKVFMHLIVRTFYREHLMDVVVVKACQNSRMCANSFGLRFFTNNFKIKNIIGKFHTCFSGLIYTRKVR
jgi:hypothetical protein